MWLLTPLSGRPVKIRQFHPSWEKKCPTTFEYLPYSAPRVTRNHIHRGFSCKSVSSDVSQYRLVFSSILLHKNWTLVKWNWTDKCSLSKLTFRKSPYANGRRVRRTRVDVSDNCVLSVKLKDLFPVRIHPTYQHKTHPAEVVKSGLRSIDIKLVNEAVNHVATVSDRRIRKLYVPPPIGFKWT